MKIEHVCQTMAQIAPLRLAESWDNVGLLLGDRHLPARRIMTCLTVTPAVVTEAEAENVNLIISHHPLPFKPMGKINTDSTAGDLVWRLCHAGISLYSAHTAYDSAIGGINEQICEGLGIQPAAPLIPWESPVESEANRSRDKQPAVGAGRFGQLLEPCSVGKLLRRAAKFFGATRPRFVGDFDRPVQRVAVACGSGGSFISAARRAGCDCLLAGEATFHNCLEAENTGLSLILVGHYASERFAMEALAQRLPELLKWPKSTATLPLQLESEPSTTTENDSSTDFADCRVWASVAERDAIGVDPNSQNP